MYNLITTTHQSLCLGIITVYIDKKTCKSESSFERQTFVCEIKDTKNWNNTENDKTAIIKNH